jgi:hypothetical protein
MIRSGATRRACDIPQHCIVYTSPLSAPNKAPSKAFHTRAVEIPVSYLLTFPPGFPPGTTRPIMASPAPRPWPCQVRPPCTPVVFSDLSFPRQASHSHDTAARRHVRWSCVHNNLSQRGWGWRSKASTYSGRHGWHVWEMAAVVALPPIAPAPAMAEVEVAVVPGLDLRQKTAMQLSVSIITHLCRKCGVMTTTC